MLRLKGCPRCGGDLALQQDLDGLLWLCVQCGHWLDAEAGGALRPALVLAAQSMGPVPGSRG